MPDHRASIHRASFRADIEGLRALAIGAVVLDHAGLAWTPGGFTGVDVFLVISGFLITSLLVREVSRDGNLKLWRFWARRARRLLPASSLVLVFSAAVTLLWLPVTARGVFGGDIASAAGYVVNWRLGYREVDYLAEQVGPSPVQHYWSLAVEEQFYVMWPVLLAIVVTACRQRWRWVLVVVIAILSASSFVFALSYSVAQPGLAFFVTTTRVWELGIGALLALSVTGLIRPTGPARGAQIIRAQVSTGRRAKSRAGSKRAAIGRVEIWRVAVGWLGFVAICIGIVGVGPSATWPGALTLLPVLGTAAVLAAGSGTACATTTRWGVGRLLSVRPAVRLGALSYSWYLWHWPFLVAAEGVWGNLRVRHNLLVVVASLGVAWLSYILVENPLRYSRRLALPRTALLLGAVTTAIAAAAGLSLIASYSLVDTTSATASQAPGARALRDPRFADFDWATIRRVDELRPSPLRAYGDLPRIYPDGCVAPPRKGALITCTYANTSNNGRADLTDLLSPTAGQTAASQTNTGADRTLSGTVPTVVPTVVLVGDSKAAQWFTPVEAIAKREGWRLVTILKNGCPFADVVLLSLGQRNPSCEQWSREALETIEQLRPDLVVPVTRPPKTLPENGMSEADYTEQAMTDGLIRHWNRVLATGAQLAPILDTPVPGSLTTPDCINTHRDNLTLCNGRKADGIPRSGITPARKAAHEVPRAHLIDMSPVTCPDNITCPAVIGGVIVYRSGTHITDTFAETTTDELANRMSQATNGLLGYR